MPNQTSSAPADLITDYGSGVLDDFFELAPGDVEAGLRLPRPAERSGLVAALRRHAGRLGAPDAVMKSIAKLEDPAARVVVTGQQTGLLLGPTYTLSKAMTAIRLAERLDLEDRPVVPVFWLASQDHDGEEIDHNYLLDASETLRRVAVDLPLGVAAGRCELEPAMVGSVAAALEAHSPRPAFEAEVMALIAASAAVAGSFADWFAAQLYRLLGESGLVLIDPLEPGIAELFAPLIARELETPQAGPRAINEAGARLEQLGHKPQLGRGADATNLFIEHDDGGGRPTRKLLRVDGAGFSAEGVSFSKADLLARLADDPASITPAAGLRPITQDHVLPTAVFVLGPGELGYVAQLRDVYKQHDVPMPLAWPRASVTVLEPAAVRLLERFGADAFEFQAEPDALLERLLLERHGHATGFGRAAGEVERLFEALFTEVSGIDPTLRGTVTRGKHYLEVTLDRLRTKAAAALARKDAESARQFERLRAHLLPLGQPAERVLGPYSHMLKFGIAPVIDGFKRIEPSGRQLLRL